MVIIQRSVLYYYFQLHVSASSFGTIFRLKHVAGNKDVKYIF